MKFDDLDARMRVFETAHDHQILPGLFIVSRLDGRGFTKLTKVRLALEAPFDVRFRDAMLATASHLMDCGLKVLYAYTQSDEISLLLARNEAGFGREMRKLLSILAGEASARFSKELDTLGAFDNRLSLLPRESDVIDYFRWRHEDAHRNSLSAHCYWKLRAEGATERDATKALEGLSVSEKNELLFQRGVNFNSLPSWQKRGTGLYWVEEEKEGRNPKTGEVVRVNRRRIRVDLELPMGEAYTEYLKQRLTD